MTDTLYKFGIRVMTAMATFGPVAAFAQSAPPLPTTTITSPQRVLGLLCDIAGWIFAFLVVLAIIFILMAAFNYLTARGNEEQVGSANQALIYSAVAIAVAVVARAVPLVVAGFLGANNVTGC